MSFRGLLAKAAGHHSPGEDASTEKQSDGMKQDKPSSTSRRVLTSPVPSAQAKDRPPAKSAPPASRGRGKITFKDLMKKADTVDRSKLEMMVKTTDKKRPEISRQRAKPPIPVRSPENSPKKTSLSKSFPQGTKFEPDKAPQSHKLAPPSLPQQKRKSAPAPVAKPSAELAARIERRRKKLQQSRQTDSELSDFVVNDSEVENDGGNRRASLSEEIWGLFNRAPKRNFDINDSEDDMVATGADILEEETRSASQARIEDAMEERRLKELDLKKKRKLSKS